MQNYCFFRVYAKNNVAKTTNFVACNIFYTFCNISTITIFLHAIQFPVFGRQVLLLRQHPADEVFELLGGLSAGEMLTPTPVHFHICYDRFDHLTVSWFKRSNGQYGHVKFSLIVYSADYKTLVILRYS